MTAIDVLVIGAGQAGLAMSRCLGDRRIDHVVLERGRRAERWRSERWDSLRLLTPNWMSRLPGWEYRGPDPDGFMRAAEFAAHLQAYADASGAPVHEQQPVVDLRPSPRGYRVVTEDTCWQARNVVLATGWCDLPFVPAAARDLSPAIHQVVPRDYRNPRDLPDGGVLVVGASATGVQLADELHDAGRTVVLAAGRHSRLPRRHRGMDIFWWLDRIGSFERTIDEMADPRQARCEPSTQVVGRPDHRDVDLRTLETKGVLVTGRLVAADGHRVRFAGDLQANAADAERRMRRVLDEIDAHIDRSGLTGEVLPATRPAPFVPRTPERRALDLRALGVRTVVWATGHRRAYPWLHVPVLDRDGEIAQRRGVTGAPGLYVLGQRFQYRRNSNFIDGVGCDARAVAGHLAARVGAGAPR